MSGFFGAVVGGGGREATATTRLTLTSKELDLRAHLSAMTVLHGGLGELLSDRIVWHALRRPVLGSPVAALRPLPLDTSTAAHCCLPGTWFLAGSSSKRSLMLF